MTEQEMQMKLALQQEKAEILRQEVAEMNKEQEYWEQVRIQASIAAMNGYQIAPIIPGCDQQDIARWSVQLADALIAELKGGE